MPVRERDGTTVWRRRDRRQQLAIWAGWLIGVLIFVQSWRFISENTI